MARENYYTILGVDQSATPDEVKRAYRALARKYHPDSGSAESNEHLFLLVTKAYDVLSDPEARHSYDLANPFLRANEEKLDAYRRNGPVESEKRPTSDAERHSVDDRMAKLKEKLGSQYSEATFSSRMAGKATGSVKRENSFFGKVSSTINRISSLADVETLFGKISSSQKTSGRSSSDSSTLFDATGNRYFLFTVDALESLNGTSRELALEGNPSPRLLRVKIPAGISDGATLRVTVPARGEDPEQSVQIRVHVKDHSLVQREDSHIVVNVPVTIGEAINGTELDVPTLEGPLRIQIPPGWDVSKRLKIRGRGAAISGSEQRGDLFVKTYVVLPTANSAELSSAAKSIDKHYTTAVRKEFPTTLVSKPRKN